MLIIIFRWTCSSDKDPSSRFKTFHIKIKNQININRKRNGNGIRDGNFQSETVRVSLIKLVIAASAKFAQAAVGINRGFIKFVLGIARLTIQRGTLFFCLLDCPILPPLIQNSTWHVSFGFVSSGTDTFKWLIEIDQNAIDCQLISPGELSTRKFHTRQTK